MRYYAPIEKLNWTFVKRLEYVLAKPFLILIREPMLIAITAYMSVSFTKNIYRKDSSFYAQFVFGCLYLLFAAYPIVFQENHHLSAGISGLMFLPIPIGGAVSVLLVTRHPLAL